MGGGYYDRDVGSSEAASGYSAQAAAAMSTCSLKDQVKSKGRDITCAAKTPIVVAMDVTSSRGDDSKILYDKLPMFFGQLMMQGYVEDTQLSFAAIGDATDHDSAPIQVCDFAAGSELDDWLKNLWLEEGGGGSGKESYELTAFYYATHCSLACLEAEGKKGIFFFTGDEGFYSEVVQQQVVDLIGDPLECNLPTAQIFERLKSKFEVFFCFPRKSMADKIKNIDAEIDKRLRREGGSVSGNLIFTLTWDVNCDLDLHCITPNGKEIMYNNKKASGGQLDVDMQHAPSGGAVENIFWELGGSEPPHGKYKITVVGYRCPKATPFNCRIKIHDETKMFSGTVGNKETVTVYEFEYKGMEFHTDPSKLAEAQAELEDKYAAYNDDVILEQWSQVLSPERILDVGDPKAIVDIMLGTVAIVNGKRDLEAYVEDLKTRGQDEIRQHNVVRALAELDAAHKGGYMDGQNVDSEAAQMAMELASLKKELATIKAAELVALLPPPSLEALLEEDLIRVASDNSATSAPAPAPAVYHSS